MRAPKSRAANHLQVPHSVCHALCDHSLAFNSVIDSQIPDLEGKRHTTIHQLTVTNNEHNGADSLLFRFQNTHPASFG